MWAWLALKAIWSGALSLARMIPLKVWACIIVAAVVGIYHVHAVRHADTAGYQRSNAEWVAAQRSSAIADQVRYMRAETSLWTALAAARKTTDTRIAQIQAKAKTLQDNLNAIRAADPPKPECRISDDRVRWANCALGYTDACDPVR